MAGKEARTRNDNVGAKCVSNISAHPNTTTRSSSHHRLTEEEPTSPLRLALARRSVKQQIFFYTDRGDRKIDIESRTGLSHQCIKWHRRLWRHECSHPRPRSNKRSSSRSSSPSVRSSRTTRREHSLRKKRPASKRSNSSSDSSVAGGSSREEKRRRQHSEIKSLDECCARVLATVLESGKDECTED